MNKKGAWNNFWIWIIVLVVILGITGFISPNVFGEALSGQSFEDALNQGQSSFGYVWSQEGFLTNTPVLNPDIDPNNWRFLDFIFGQIPDYLIIWVGGMSASIIVLGIWVLFLLVFADSLTLFGNFSRPVIWLIAVILTIIVANLKLIMFITVGTLVVTSIFGALSVLVSIALAFGFFIAWHFGTSEVRKFIYKRRAQDRILRAEVGTKEITTGMHAAAEMGRAAAAEGEK